MGIEATPVSETPVSETGSDTVPIKCRIIGLSVRGWTQEGLL